MNQFSLKILVVLAIGATACLQRSSSTFRLLATDDPFPYSSVASARVTLSTIELIGDARTVELPAPGVTLDLVQLRNGLTQTLADLDPPSGRYTQIRLIVSSAVVDLKDGRHLDLKVPSGEESGIKVFLKPAIDIEDGRTQEVLLDFDISHSFVALGDASSAEGIRGFIFKPVIRAVSLGISGSVGGNVSCDGPVQGATVSAVQNGVTITTSITDERGNYRLIGLPEGGYVIRISSPACGSRDIPGVNVGPGTEQTVDLNLGSAA